MAKKTPRRSVGGSRKPKTETKPKQEEQIDDNSPFVFQRDKINFHLNIRERNDFTENQIKLKQLILDKETKVVFISGPAGTSKTMMAIYCGLHLLNERRVSDIMYHRTIIESASKSLGSLPGDEALKMEPFLMPLYDKMEELLPSPEIKRLMEDTRIKGSPVNYCRGASYNAKYIVLDESQNFTYKELTTAITRIGKYSKMIILADPLQSDIGDRTGFERMMNVFDDQDSRDNGIHTFKFTKDDIVRSGILKFIAEKLENADERRVHVEDKKMFV